MQGSITRRLVVVVALAAGLAGCGGSAATSPPPPVATPTAEPVSKPTPPPPTSPAALDLRASPEALAAGRYTGRGFVPRVTFEVGDGWRAVDVVPGFWNLQNADRPDAVALQFARPDGIYRAPGELMGPSTAQGAANTIQANTALTVAATSSSLLSGHAGIVLEIESASPAGAGAQVIHVPPGPLLVEPGRRLWLALFDTPEGLLAIMVVGSATDWEAALAAAEPVLESVTIGL